MPILSHVQSQSDYVFHIVQFTWATSEKKAIVNKTAQELNLIYSTRTISRKPTAILGNMYTLYKGIIFLKNYIKSNNISIVMPRSTMPTIMVNRIPKSNFKLVFDADGLPLEERVDFSGLSRNSMQYQFFKKEEYNMLSRADIILTRSHEAIKIHSKTLGNNYLDKFSLVINGRDMRFFSPNRDQRNELRNELNIDYHTKVFVYCGSLGPQYGWEEMIAIFKGYHEKNVNSFFLILTGNIEFAQERIPIELKHLIKIVSVPFAKIPNYLSVADVAFAIREPKFSMKGVAPIKLGEYLLMGIPTIASSGIGDTEELLNRVPDCHLYNHQNSSRIDEAVAFVLKSINPDFERIREYGINYFSIENSAISYCNALNKLK